MYCYSVYDKNDVTASVLTDISDPEKFSEEMHQFMCGEDFSYRGHLSINDFCEHMINKGFECKVIVHETDYLWWLKDF